jgi:hypothetical protein
MKKQREIQHALQRKLLKSEESENALRDAISKLDEDYSNQISQLKNILQEKVDVIQRLEIELEKGKGFL